MKKTIAALIAGIVLGSVGTAGAVGGYWKQSGVDYSCEGVTAGVICKSGGFRVGTTQDFVYVQKGTGRNAPTYGCRKWQSWSSCFKG